MKVVILFITTFLYLFASGQNYPVQLHSVLVPPYSGYLPDYCDPFSQKLGVQLTLLDLAEPAVEVRLQIRITGQGFTIESSPSFLPDPIVLNPGVPVLVSGMGLVPYLETDNLVFTGLDPEVYESGQTLPEGSYEICITAFEYWNPVQTQVSNSFCHEAYFTLNDPPLLSLPACNMAIPGIEPQQLFFSWMPQHPISSQIAGTDYLMELWEIFPDSADPEMVVQSSLPMFAVTTQLTHYYYGITDPVLVNNKSYVWRVRAIDTDGRALFRNNGYSAACSFTYGNALASLGNNAAISLQGQVITHRQSVLWWNTFSYCDEYLLQVKKQGAGNWFELTADSGTLKLNDLEPGLTYECRVQGLNSGNTITPWSNLYVFTMQQAPVYSCNSTVIYPDVLSSKPLVLASPGMIFKAGQFEMNVNSIQPGNSPGYYSGLGKITASFGISLRVRFQSIYVNDNHTVVSGEINAITDGISSWLGQWEYNDAFFFSGSIDSILTQNGQVFIINQDGDTILLQQDYSAGLLITDANGNQWVVNPDGSVTPVNGGGLLPVSSAPLGEQELQILRSALFILKNEISDQALDSIQNVLLLKEQQLDQHIQQQRHVFSSNNEEGDVVFLGTGGGSVSTTSVSTNMLKDFKANEVIWNENKIMYTLAREVDTTPELNFLGKHLTIDNKAFGEFVAMQIAAGRSPNQIAYDTAILGLKMLVKKVVRKKMNPSSGSG